MPTLSSYSYSSVKRILNTKIHGRLSNLTSGDTSDSNIERDLINSAVRVAMSEVDFRGNTREVLLTPNLMDNQYDYAIPNDVKADNIIDFSPQNTDSRGEFEEYHLVPQSEFDRRKQSDKGIFTIVNDELTRKLRVSANVEDQTAVVSFLDNKNDPDTWMGFGITSDSDVKTDADNYVEADGAVRFSDTVVGAGDSVIGIQNRGITAFDISPYLSRGSFFVNGRLDSGDTGIKSINLRLGSDSNNYYQFSDSTQNDCSAFQAGWNLLRLDASSKTTVGTPTDTAIDYAAIYWGRDSGTHLDTDFAFDYLIGKRGKYYNLVYYSRYLWQDTAYALSENSTHDSHALLVQNDELEVIMAKAAELASAYLRDREDQKYFAGEYERLKNVYLMRNPSQSVVRTSTRYNFLHDELDTDSDS